MIADSTHETDAMARFIATLKEKNSDRPERNDRPPAAWARRERVRLRDREITVMVVDKCPICGKGHQHGAGGFGASDGPKIRHCVDRDCPDDAPSSYVMIEAGVPLLCRSSSAALPYMPDLANPRGGLAAMTVGPAAGSGLFGEGVGHGG